MNHIEIEIYNATIKTQEIETEIIINNILNRMKQQDQGGKQ